MDGKRIVGLLEMKSCLIFDERDFVALDNVIEVPDGKEQDGIDCFVQQHECSYGHEDIDGGYNLQSPGC